MQPRIIPRSEHRLSRKQISANVLSTLYRLRDQGFIAYLVGGCVRDLLLGQTPKDFDIVTDAAPSQIKKLFRNCRLVGRRFRLAHLHFAQEIIEVSTFRAVAADDEAQPDDAQRHDRPPLRLINDEGMVLRDNVFGTPAEDARRRDFTINALFYNIVDFTLIDYTGGLNDLREGVIRPIGDPCVRFTEDPVRMLRAVRFAASRHFSIEAQASKTISELAETITRASPARLYEEVLKLFLFGSALPVFDLMEASGLLAALFPAVSHWMGQDSRNRDILSANLDYIDRQCRSGAAASAPLFFTALLGPMLEEAALARRREGIPRNQALDYVCVATMQAICKIVSIPGRVGNQMRGILAMQSLLHRRPPRRPAVTAGRPEFADSLAYLRLSAPTKSESRAALNWWDAFVSGEPAPIFPDMPIRETTTKRRRKKRRRRRPAVNAQNHGAKQPIC